MALSIVDRVKSSQGRIPVKSVRLFGCSSGLREGDIAFELESPQSLDRAAEGGLPAHLEPKLGLEDLSVARRGGFVTEDEVAELAAKTGPLFGRSDRESVADWLNVLAIAHNVVTMQEVLNGAKPLSAGTMPVGKSVVEAVRTDETFEIFSVAFALGSDGESDYERLMPELPLLKKFRAGGSYDYAFAAKEVEEGSAILYLLLLSFKREIAASDFAAAVAYFLDDEDVARRALPLYEGGMSDEGALGLISGADDLAVTDHEVGEADFPHIQRLIYALISLHLEGVRIDVFDSNESDDFMVFDSYLSYLWYDFAKKLGKVRIGYCEQCGKGFSLTGHRGIKRRFCSEACKTKAKNERMRQQRDSVRESFAKGRSVDEIARALFKTESGEAARQHVISQLKGWKRLQRDIDAAILLRDERRDLLKRCLDEGVISEEALVERVRAIQSDPRLRREIARREGVR